MNKFYLILLIVPFLFSCSDSTPLFDSESSFKILEAQCELGPRYPGSDGIQLCREYIINNLEVLGIEAELQKFKATPDSVEFKGVNILASIYPERSRRILLAAHYDTRPWADKETDPALHNQPILGANDGASGVAVLLEIARVVTEKTPKEFGIDLVFFDLEDSGSYGNNESWCLGSSYYAANHDGNKPEKAIVVDMIGDKDLSINMEYYSYHNSPSLVREVWEAADFYDFNQFKTKITNAIYDDHYPLIIAGFEAIDIIDFEYPQWHTLQDTPENCSATSLQVVGQTLLKVIYQ